MPMNNVICFCFSFGKESYGEKDVIIRSRKNRRHARHKTKMNNVDGSSHSEQHHATDNKNVEGRVNTKRPWYDR